MSFSFNHRKSGTVNVIDLGGRIVLGDSQKQLSDSINELIGQGERDFLLNMGDVTYVDSAGLGAIVRCYNAAVKNQGRIKLLSVPPHVVRLLHITKLQTFFETFDNETEAVSSYNNP